MTAQEPEDALSKTIKFRLMAVNPSKTKTQKVNLMTYLPAEVQQRDVLDSGGLELEYDAQKSAYYVFRNGVELAPSEIKKVEVEVRDVWNIRKSSLSEFKGRVETLIQKLEKTDYYPKAKEIADSIYVTLDDIEKSQDDQTVSPQQHIGIYRQNLLLLERVKEDIARLEKALATAGGPLSPEMLTKTKIKSEEPSKAMTWIVIFSIVIFTGLLAGVLFFTWYRQSRLTKEDLLAAKKAAFPDAGPKKDNDKL
ncbi:MAG TPA: hypothetical protein VJA84_01930 [Candidatus Omnitrophota bacterium]|nr:hypothetical protein [Candidatus Omnitrophota bacterium]